MPNFQFHSKRVTDGQTWGLWKLNAAKKELAYTGGHNWRVDLSTINNSAQLADWIF